MLPFSCFKGSSVALFGLGASGISAALALEAGGAHPVCWDDNSQSVEKAVAKGLTVRDLRQEDWSRFVSFVLSPGAPLTHPEPHWSVDFARAKGVEIIGDIELFARERRIQAPMAPFIAITGTNGKSTTTALIAHILKQAGCSVEMGGNIGRPVGDFSSLSSRTYYVIECSSFQIDLAPSLDPTVGILLNLTPDHLDRHGSMEHYASVKERLVSAAHTAVIGIDDDYCSEIFVRLRGLSDDVVSICSSLSEKDGYSVEGESLIYRQAGQSSYIASLRHVFRLSGQHNRQNALAAVAACIRMDISRQNIQSGLESFPGLPHRMETIGRKGRVLFVNDSKATNADSSAAALSTFDPVYWILGGLPKAGGIESLCSFFPRIAKAYLIGEAAPLFSKTLDGAVPFEISGTLSVAVQRAAEQASLDPAENPVVLLSPACASFDQFNNFEVRGEAFFHFVSRLDGVELFVDRLASL